MESLTLPPEITSALIHSGPGAESLIEAAAAWQLLGTNLEESASTSASVLSSLAGSWHGPSALAMVQAVEVYLTWIRATALQALQVSASAHTAAAAFNSARASVVPVAAVTANRTRLAHLLATNRFGANLPAIAQTEHAYQTMWANNSAAMIRYQAVSKQATTLPQFASPPSVTDPGVSNSLPGISFMPHLPAESFSQASFTPPSFVTFPLSSALKYLVLIDQSRW